MSARRAARYSGIVAVILFAGLCLYSFRSTSSGTEDVSDEGYHSPSTVLPDYISPHGVPSCNAKQDDVSRLAGTPSGEEDSIDATKIEEYVAQHLQAKQGHFNPQADKEWLGINLGAWDLASYRHELMDTYDRYFKNDTVMPDYMHLVESRLSLRSHATYPPRPRQILTTTKELPLPLPFQRWRSLHRGWKIRIFDDTRMAQWIDEAFGGTGGRKYMALLLGGGVYTDTDTAPVIPISEWGQPYTTGTDPLLSHLSTVLSSSGTSTDKPEDEPALVLSVESDAIDFGWDDWRSVGLVRAVQIVQWTMAARPGHPVFLDAIGRTLRKTEELAILEQQAQETGEPFTPPSALDCVYRYLLARWGFHPREILHLKEPLRIGDVLILPTGSFHSVSPWEPREKWRPYAAVWHGFWGRWRADDGDELQRGLENVTKEALGRE
ncbi:hypothetical protein QFC20_007732 [Naganishia adeliensis]|uniref:Uncharacterized protein n=1 Tax=Naganishia adeliensis TaxID=92952 RepID=A0ACC2UW19_9TREE|nr:hypothetical protein QFC20_007732 [Naganishia adeliensis]